MTLTGWDLAVYAGGLFILVMTPGPVWLATMARAMSGGFRAAWPLGIGVAVGDLAWSLLAILGVSWVVALAEPLEGVLKLVASVVLIFIGVMTIRKAKKPVGSDSRLTRPGLWAGFTAGLIVILSNPKAIFFYMALLPGFFDLASFTPGDTAVVAGLSAAVPLAGNLAIAALVDRVRRLLSSPKAVARMNIGSGVLLLLVGVALPFV